MTEIRHLSLVEYKGNMKAAHIKLNGICILEHVHILEGAWGSVVVKALRYYSDGPGIDSRWCHLGSFRQNLAP